MNQYCHIAVHPSPKEQTFFNYRPQQSCEGYVFTCMCLSTGGGVPGQVPPRTRYIPLPPGPGNSPPPGPGTPPGTRYTPQDQVHPPGPSTPPGIRYTTRDELHPPGTRYPPPETATVADGKHPTGMHSCFIEFLRLKNITCLWSASLHLREVLDQPLPGCQRGDSVIYFEFS